MEVKKQSKMEVSSTKSHMLHVRTYAETFPPETGVPTSDD